MANHWFVYIVRCSDGSLYTGVTNSVDQTVKELNAGGGASYVRSRAPVFLAHTEEYMNETDADRRAGSIKRLARTGKEELLSSAGVSAIGGLAFGV